MTQEASMDLQLLTISLYPISRSKNSIQYHISKKVLIHTDRDI